MKKYLTEALDRAILLIVADAIPHRGRKQQKMQEKTLAKKK
jgi:hypothetical protein